VNAVSWPAAGGHRSCPTGARAGGATLVARRSVITQYVTMVQQVYAIRGDGEQDLGRPRGLQLPPKSPVQDGGHESTQLGGRLGLKTLRGVQLGPQFVQVRDDVRLLS